MRILVADHDALMLQAAAHELADDFDVDVATSKLSCLAMLDVSEYHIIICCERLEDGSGLELLSQAGKRWPEVLRVLAIEPDRMPLLAGRLKPFRLFETLPYPLNPDKLRNVLLLAQATEEAHVDTMNVQHIVLEDEFGAAEQQPVAATARGGRGASSSPRAPQANAPRGRVPSGQASRSVAPRFTAAGSTGSGPALSATANRRLSSEQRGTISFSDADSFADIDALTEASQIAAATRPRLERAPNLLGKQRTALFVVAGIGAAAAATAAMMFSGKDSAPSLPPAPVALKSVQPLAVENSAAEESSGTATPPEGMSFESPAAAAPLTVRAVENEPPEVVAFVADIESALTVENFARARSLLDMLRQAAPDYSRLAFFDALIARGEETKALRVQPPAPAGTRPTAPPRPRTVAAERQAALRALAPPVVEPAVVAPIPTEPPPVVSNTFSGRTLEDSQRSGESSSGSALPEAEAVRRPAPVVLPEVKEAKVVRQVEPEYPRDAMLDGVEGSIDLRFTVTAEGKVEDIEVVSANPPQTFDRAAMSALRRWRYEPRREDGVAVDSRTRVRLEFKLDNSRRR